MMDPQDELVAARAMYASKRAALAEAQQENTALRENVRALRKEVDQLQEQAAANDALTPGQLLWLAARRVWKKVAP